MESDGFENKWESGSGFGLKAPHTVPLYTYAWAAGWSTNLIGGKTAIVRGIWAANFGDPVDCAAPSSLKIYSCGAVLLFGFGKRVPD